MLNMFSSDNWAKWALKMDVLFIFHKIDRNPCHRAATIAAAALLRPPPDITLLVPTAVLHPIVRIPPVFLLSFPVSF